MNPGQNAENELSRMVQLLRFVWFWYNRCILKFEPILLYSFNLQDQHRWILSKCRKLTEHRKSLVYGACLCIACSFDKSIAYAFQHWSILPQLGDGFLNFSSTLLPDLLSDFRDVTQTWSYLDITLPLISEYQPRNYYYSPSFDMPKQEENTYYFSFSFLSSRFRRLY